MPQITDSARIIFLRKFTQEIILTLSKKHKTKKRVEIEKLKQKFLEPLEPPEKTFEKIAQTQILKQPHYPIIKTKPIDRPPAQLKKRFIPKTSRVPSHIKSLTRPVKPQTIKIQQNLPPIEKIKQLLKDKTIQSLECPGPGKNILVKRYNKINATRLILSQEDISKIINNFSEQSNIPVVGGILKAAVDDLIISAVTSEFIGSKFIINKITPYNLIKKP
ncbi:hypothetical protein HOD75_03660 [archaeon]|jgi:hypothetical protein|nr:hypothetical protein [archaeon]MBT4241968.1 hypothetical protein [archaeon]MBT4418515.1 hypothetical protein [archaeon]